MTSNASTTLPAFVQAVIDAADESETFVIPEGIPHASASTATIARIGAVTVGIGHMAGQMSWHIHDDEESARECHQRNVEHARETQEFLLSGKDARILALAAQTGMPVEMAEILLPEVLAQMEGEPTIPVPAVGRAPVPAVEVDLGPDTPWTGMYL